MTTAEKIRYQRKKAGMTQAELGEKLGVRLAAVSKWELGRVYDIPASKLRALSTIFDVPVSYFVDDDVDTPVEKPDPAADYREVISGEGYRILLDASANLTEAQVKAVADFIRFQQSQNDKV